MLLTIQKFITSQLFWHSQLLQTPGSKKPPPLQAEEARSTLAKVANSLSRQANLQQAKALLA
jgi:hypothetical protein